jgi:ribosomal-protein-alanine N-acetyltransferase
LRFIPEKRLLSVADAERWLNGAIINSHSGRNSVHFITCKNTGALVGIVDIIPPSVAKEYYQLNHYPFFIEFYLDTNAKDKAIMTGLLPLIVADLKQQGIQHMAAVVNRKNFAARRVLGKSGFIYSAAFDPIQDFYELPYSA